MRYEEKLLTHFLGMELKNPIIVGSSALSGSPDGVIKAEKAGAGAVILKSLFEEQLRSESGIYGNVDTLHPENWDYMNGFGMQIRPMDYIMLVESCKRSVKIPVIASINCQEIPHWNEFAILLQNAGADALELNIAPFSMDISQAPGVAENLILEIVDSVRKHIKIPLILKISQHFSALPWLVDQAGIRGVGAVTLFNRLYRPDIDIHNLTWTSGDRFSSENEFTSILRWIAVLSGRGPQVSVSGGIHSGETMVKALLAGATTVQLASAIYLNSMEIITTILEGAVHYMEERRWESLEDFQAAFRWDRGTNAEFLSRRQYIQNLIGKEN